MFRGFTRGEGAELSVKKYHGIKLSRKINIRSNNRINVLRGRSICLEGNTLSFSVFALNKIQPDIRNEPGGKNRAADLKGSLTSQISGHLMTAKETKVTKYLFYIQNHA